MAYSISVAVGDSEMMESCRERRWAVPPTVVTVTGKPAVDPVAAELLAAPELELAAELLHAAHATASVATTKTAGRARVKARMIIILR
jgi:hypothetical protein